ncbi:MAG: adenosine deaminase [Saprospiraceae bacterium]
MDLSKLPKIELHLHLDCSLSFSFVRQLEACSPESYQSRFVAPAKCRDLNEYLQYALSGIAVLQTKTALENATLDLFEQLRADNVIYAEIRFAPLEHRKKGLAGQEVVQVVSKAMQEGSRQTGIQAGLILCTLRNYSEVQSLETATLAAAFKADGVVGFDIAADEAGFSIQNHIAAFHFARTNGIHCTAHAGEACGPESVWESIREFAPQRIGHGVRSVEDPSLVDFLREHKIHLEVCPTSNIQTNVYPGLPDHPIDKLYRSGVSLGINTDARTISNVTLTDEYQKLAQTFHWGKTEFLACNLAAVDHAFTRPEVKAALRQRLLAGFEG